MAKFSNEKELFFIYDNNPEHYPKMTDKEHLDICIKEHKKWYDIEEVYVYRAAMNLSGFYAKGEYMGRF